MIVTVAIPTYNRCKRLLQLLSILERDDIPPDQAEILIIDNHSDDGTEQMVSGFLRKIPSLRFVRNRENVGMANNFINCMAMGRGEFTWIVGDDDLLLPGGILRIIRYIIGNPEVDFFVSSLTILTDRDLERGLPDEEKLRTPRYRRWASDRRILWDDLVDPLVDEVFLGALMISVFRTSILRPILPTDPYIEAYRFTSLETSYPHAYLYGKAFVGRNAMFIAEPLVAAVEWKKEWSRYTPMMVTCRLNQMLDHYQESGVAGNRIRECRSFLFRSYGATFWSIVFETDRRYRQDFSLIRQIARYGTEFAFWKAILYDPLIRRPWKSMLRLLKRSAKKILRHPSAV